MANNSKCSKCGAEMVKGFFFDRGHLEYKTQQAWVEGEPEETFWSGLKTSGKKAYSVGAFRCVSCGMLELYTREQIDI